MTGALAFWQAHARWPVKYVGVVGQPILAAEDVRAVAVDRASPSLRPAEPACPQLGDEDGASRPSVDSCPLAPSPQHHDWRRRVAMHEQRSAVQVDVVPAEPGRLTAARPHDDRQHPGEAQRVPAWWNRVHRSGARSSRAVEVKTRKHPASIVARRDRNALFQGEAERGGAPKPAVLAQQLTIRHRHRPA
jgi:hypothetical protein